MGKRILMIIAGVLLINAVPSSASLYFDWIDPLPKLGHGYSSYMALYNPPDALDFPGQWYEGGWGDANDYFDNVAFILKSNSGQTGLVPVKIKVTLSGNVFIQEHNATITGFGVSYKSLTYGIQSLDNYDVFGMHRDHFENEISYSFTNSFLSSFEIGKLYQVSGFLMNLPPYIMGPTAIDPNSYAHVTIYDESHGDIALSTVPEPSTMLLLGAGLLGGIRLRRRATNV